MTDMTILHEGVEKTPLYFRTKAGLPALVVLTKLGHHCGYVMAPIDELVGIDCTHHVYRDVEVHGGLTFAGEIEGMWYVGFDCAHAGDAFAPGSQMAEFYKTIGFEKHGVFRDEEYVKAECEKLAEQLVKIGETVRSLGILPLPSVPAIEMVKVLEMTDIEKVENYLDDATPHYVLDAWERIKEELGDLNATIEQRDALDLEVQRLNKLVNAPPAALAVPEGYAAAIKAVQEMMPPRDFRPSAQVWLTGNQVNELHARLDAAAMLAAVERAKGGE